MRQTEIIRKTAETDITLTLCLDGDGKGAIDTGCGFLDHMLTLFSRHGSFDLNVKCIGDTQVDYHHTAEDIAICLGDAVKKACFVHARNICKIETISQCKIGCSVDVQTICIVSTVSGLAILIQEIGSIPIIVTKRIVGGL